MSAYIVEGKIAAHDLLEGDVIQIPNPWRPDLENAYEVVAIYGAADAIVRLCLRPYGRTFTRVYHYRARHVFELLRPICETEIYTYWFCLRCEAAIFPDVGAALEDAVKSHEATVHGILPSSAGGTA